MVGRTKLVMGVSSISKHESLIIKFKLMLQSFTLGFKLVLQKNSKAVMFQNMPFLSFCVEHPVFVRISLSFRYFFYMILSFFLKLMLQLVQVMRMVFVFVALNVRLEVLCKSKARYVCNFLFNDVQVSLIDRML